MVVTHQDRDDHRRLRRSDRRKAVYGVASREGLQPVRHGQDTTNSTRIIAEKDSSECYEEAHNDSWPGSA